MGSVMSLALKKFNDKTENSKSSLLGVEKIKEMGLIASMGFFTSGTERRFHEIDEDIEELKIVQKYEKLTKN